MNKRNAGCSPFLGHSVECFVGGLTKQFFDDTWPATWLIMVIINLKLTKKEDFLTRFLRV